MKYYLTLVTDPKKTLLSDDILNRIRDFLASHNITILENIILSENEAYDILLEFDKSRYENIYTLIKSFLKDDLIDCFLLDHTQKSIKKLVMFDMDATLIENECIDEIARAIGKYNDIAKITQDAMRGNLLFEHSLERRVEELKGVKQEVLEQVLNNQISLSPGTSTVAKTLKKYNTILAIASGGFTYFTNAIARQLNFDYDFANTLEIINNQLTGKLVPPIYAGIDKANSLKNLLSSLDIALDDVIAVGDGSNDIPMITSIPLGISYHAKPVVNESTFHNLKHTSLTSILFVQGIKKTNFVF